MFRLVKLRQARKKLHRSYKGSIEEMLINKALYSTYLDCKQLGEVNQARRILRANF